MFKREFRKVNVYGFLEPVVVVPENRTKTNHTMKLYKQSPRGLYLGRVENNNQHLVMTTDGIITKAHSVRSINLYEAEILKILNAHEASGKEIKDPSGYLYQEIMDEASIKPKPDYAKIVAARASGSKGAWKAKTSNEQKQLRSMFAPTPRGTGTSENILTKSDVLVKNDGKPKSPKRNLQPLGNKIPEPKCKKSKALPKKNLKRPPQEP